MSWHLFTRLTRWLPCNVGGLIGGLSHVARLGLTAHLDTPIERGIDRLRGALIDRYGPIIVAEHGPRKCDLGAGCCDHAHMHLIPVPTPDRAVKEYVKIGGPTEPYRTLAECLASIDEAYVYVSPATAVHYVWPASKFPRQWVRRVCADIYGKASQWDWRDHPFDLERRLTYEALVGMSLFPSARIP